MKQKVYMTPNPATPNNPVEFNENICNGCNKFAEICRNDVLMPNPQKRKPPIVLYSDECWYCGCCVQECKRPGAITMTHPLNQSLPVGWKRVETGKNFRLGVRVPPPPNPKPPSG